MTRYKESDLIRTPRWCVEKLLEFEEFPPDSLILEPCCGDGAIAKVLEERGFRVRAIDKYNHGYGEVKDLFEETERYDFIITNPPFTRQQAVKRHLIKLARKRLILLWYLKNLGQELETWTGRFLRRVYILGKIDWKEADLGWFFAWYVWDLESKSNEVVVRDLRRQVNQLNLTERQNGS